MSTLPEMWKIGLGVGLGFLAFKLLSSKDSHSVKECEQNEQEIVEQQKCIGEELAKLAQLQQVLNKKAINLQIEYVPNMREKILTKNFIKQFIQQASQVIESKQFVEATLSNRQARRKVFPQIDHKYETYYRFVCTLDENVKYLIDKAEKDLAVFVNIKFEDFNQSVTYHIDSDYEQQTQVFKLEILQLMSEIREKLIIFMPAFSNPIPQQLVSEILTYQTNLLKSQKNFLIELVKSMGLETREEQQALPLFLTSFLQDSAWEKYHVEAESMSISQQNIPEGLASKIEIFKQTRNQVLTEIFYSIQNGIRDSFINQS